MAVAEPRIHQQDLPDLLRVEPGAIDKQTDEALRAKGHEVHWGDEPQNFGAVTAIVRSAAGWEGTSDPRGGGAAMGD
jgi:gamma-glutamyltranspeptidase